MGCDDVKLEIIFKPQNIFYYKSICAIMASGTFLMLFDFQIPLLHKSFVGCNTSSKVRCSGVWTVRQLFIVGSIWVRTLY